MAGDAGLTATGLSAATTAGTSAQIRYRWAEDKHRRQSAAVGAESTKFGHSRWGLAVNHRQLAPNCRATGPSYGTVEAVKQKCDGRTCHVSLGVIALGSRRPVSELRRARSTHGLERMNTQYVRAVLKGWKRKRKEFVTPTETNVHEDALCFMVIGPSLL